MRRVFVVLLVSLLVLGSVPRVFAGAKAAGTISGIAKTTAGEPLGGYTVRVRSVRTGELMTTTTTSMNGSFAAANLDPGSYVVEIVDRTGKLVGASTIATVIDGRTASVGIVAASTEHVGGALKKRGALLLILGGGGAAAIVGIAVAANGDEGSPSD